MITRSVLLSILVTLSFSVCAQIDKPVGNLNEMEGMNIEESKIESPAPPELMVEFNIKDEKSAIYVSDSIQSFVSLMDSLDAQSEGQTGFRIQLFSNSGPKAKENAFKKQAEFIQLYPDIPSYTLWKSPNWVLRVGDYRTRLEARQFLDLVKISNPAAFVVSDKVKSKFAK